MANWDNLRSIWEIWLANLYHFTAHSDGWKMSLFLSLLSIFLAFFLILNQKLSLQLVLLNVLPILSFWKGFLNTLTKFLPLSLVWLRKHWSCTSSAVCRLRHFWRHHWVFHTQKSNAFHSKTNTLKFHIIFVNHAKMHSSTVSSKKKKKKEKRKGK